MYIDQLLQKAHAKHMQGKYDAAVRAYRDILKINPRHLDANYLLGTLYAEMNDLAAAKQYLEKADGINPNSPYIKVNLGNICKQQGDYETAREYYEQALSLKSDLPQAYFGLGNILETVSSDIDGAFQHYHKAMQLSPTDPFLLQAIGKSLLKLGNTLAIDCFQMAVRMNPRLPGINRDFGIGYVKFGRYAEGARYLRQSLMLSPQDTEAHYYLNIAEGRNPDKELQQEYVREEFDRFAAEFDSVLVDKLEYTIPEKIVAFLAETLPAGVHFKACADLGCGTGLFGVAVKDQVDYLVGVDISSRMLELAKARNCYDALQEGDIVASLQDSAVCYDLFAATDVLVYMGELDDLFATLNAKAMPGAVFVCSTEALDGEGYILQSTGRYAHSRPYLEAVADRNGCQVLASRRVPLRKEFGNWIEGDIYIIRLASPRGAQG